MKSAKQTVREILNQLPEKASLEDIQYHIYVHEKIKRGLKDIKAGRVLTQDAVEKRISKWL